MSSQCFILTNGWKDFWYWVEIIKNLSGQVNACNRLAVDRALFRSGDGVLPSAYTRKRMGALCQTAPSELQISKRRSRNRQDVAGGWQAEQ